MGAFHYVSRIEIETKTGFDRRKYLYHIIVQRTVQSSKTQREGTLYILYIYIWTVAILYHTIPYVAHTNELYT